MREAVFVTLTDLLARTRSSRLLVAYSGGRDSTALLHLAAAFADRRHVQLGAVHVDHGLDPASAEWAERCRVQAARLGIDCVVLRVAATPPAGASIEAWARDQRYSRLAALCDASTLVLTGHHEDDQAETVLHRVLAGAGPHGLSGMPTLRSCGAGFLGRPLLACSRASIDDYVVSHDLRWVDDPANRNQRFVRNRLRSRLLPSLDDAVPGARRGLIRLARIQRDVVQGLDRYADALIDAAGLPVWQLAASSLSTAGAELAPFVLRRALSRVGFPRPGRRQLLEILGSLCQAQPAAQPVVRWGGYAVRRYRERLYFTPATLPLPPARPASWDCRAEFELPWGTLRARAATMAEPVALDPARLQGPAEVSIRFRHGGERCQPFGRGHGQSLKKLFQAWAIPPWERALLPLVYIGGELAAVPGYCVAAPFAADRGEGIVFDWAFDFYPQRVT